MGGGAIVAEDDGVPVLGPPQAHDHMRLNPRTQLLLAVTLLFAVAACSPTIDTRGYVPNETLIAQVKTGIDDRLTVSRVLGSPSTIATFSDETWYYVSRRTEQFAFFDAEVLDQSVLAVDFDERGFVSGLRRYALEDGRVIDPVTRETPTLGRELGIIEQLFGNVGRFTGPAGQTDP